MKVLCDTHILIWYMTGDERLSAKARDIIDDINNKVYFSIVSVWGVSVKHGHKPDKLTLSAQDFVKYWTNKDLLNIP